MAQEDIVLTQFKRNNKTTLVPENECKFEEEKLVAKNKTGNWVAVEN